MRNKVHRNALPPGHKVLWYEMKRILGRGGFGITYLALDTNLNQYVAIKEYLPTEVVVRDGDALVHPLSDDHAEEYQWGLVRFIGEAQTLARFDHPNIVRVHSVFQLNNTAYMVMRYEEGKSLEEILKGRNTLEEAALLTLLLPILGGLEKVHDSGFVHRDIKPANLFIRVDGSPVLLDFGAARQALGERTRTLTSFVSPGYAPFEQYYSRSDEQGPWTDIYGLGATLYRAIAGVAPMDAVDRSKAVMQAASQDRFIAASRIGKGRYSERFLKAIDHALQFHPQDRPQRIAEWRREFEAAEGPKRAAGNAEDEQRTEIVTARLAPTEIVPSVSGLLAGSAKAEGPQGTAGSGPKQVVFKGHKRVLGALGGLTITAVFAWLYLSGLDPVGEIQSIPDNKGRQAGLSLPLEPTGQDAAEASEKKIEQQNQDEQLKAAEGAYNSGNYGEALRLFKPLAEQGAAAAQFYLGVMYENGLGVSQDYAEAVKWYRKAAEQGDDEAQNNLGILYVTGRGVTRKYAEAVKWYRKAAEQGNTKAQNNLGIMYERGLGVSRDYAEAVKWYRKAAEQGEEGAKGALKRLGQR